MLKLRQARRLRRQQGRAAHACPPLCRPIRNLPRHTTYTAPKGTPQTPRNAAVEGDRDNPRGCPSLPGTAPHKSLRKPPRPPPCLIELWTCWTTLQVDHMPTAACCVLTTCPPNSLLKIPPRTPGNFIRWPMRDSRREKGGSKWAKRSLTRFAGVGALPSVSRRSAVGHLRA